ncbi:MAG: hypothetical protein SWX82_04475 [Cyanobacteriota bacterium]|nr:hypothetical protein [Cyanobacteriota bacterium]
MRNTEAITKSASLQVCKSEVNPPLAPPRRGSRGFEQLSKNISPIKAGLRDPIILIKLSQMI